MDCKITKFILLIFFINFKVLALEILSVRSVIILLFIIPNLASLLCKKEMNFIFNAFYLLKGLYVKVCKIRSDILL